MVPTWCSLTLTDFQRLCKDLRKPIWDRHSSGIIFFSLINLLFNKSLSSFFGDIIII